MERGQVYWATRKPIQLWGLYQLGLQQTAYTSAIQLPQSAHLGLLLHVPLFHQSHGFFFGKLSLNTFRPLTAIDSRWVL